MRLLTLGRAAFMVTMGWLAACGTTSVLYEPTPELLSAVAPDSFVVEFVTSEGPFLVTMHRDWSPLGVDRAYQLMKNDFYAGARVYRMLPDFVAQWGFSGDPVLDSVWEEHAIDDEPTVASNERGVVSFARAGPRTRSYTLFINLVDNTRLDDAVAGGVAGYPPIGRIVGDGTDVVAGFYAAYVEDPPVQDSISIQGNDYLRRRYPQLDSIITTRVIVEWP
jgi:cyclophilin family peptidyl-prolyl cis-trans isomerase